MSSRPYHHGNLRAELLEHAERTVREAGAQALSLRELARAAGVSHGAPRRHFADRQALLDALAEVGFARLEAEVADAAEAAEPGHEQRVRAVAGAYVDFATRDAALLELMFAAKHREAAGSVREAADRTFATMAGLLAGGAGEVDAAERRVLVLFATLQGAATLSAAGMLDGEAVERIVDDATGLFVHRPRTVA
jgi:AcrR family transcriptional regulator